MSGAKNTGILSIWTPAAPVRYNKRPAEVAMLPWYKCRCRFDMLGIL